jgi:hypothetical protein
MVMVGIGLALMPGAAAARSDLELRFDATIEVVPDEGSSLADASKKPKPKAAAEATPVRVVVGPGRIVDERRGIVRIYDFHKHRLLTIDRAAGRYTDESLFPVLGFRVMEFQNRVGLAGVLEGAKVKEAPLPIPLSEHLFSLDDSETKAKIDRTVETGMVTFSWERKPLFAFSEKVVAAGPDERARFVQFVRYVHGGHPDVLKALESLDGVPVRLVITQRDGPRTTMTALALKAHARVAVPPIAFDGLERGVPEGLGEPFRKLVKTARSEGPKAHAPRAQALIDRQKRALADGKGLDSFLALAEYGLQMGEPMPGLDATRLRAVLAADADLRLLQTALQPPADADGAARAVATLKALNDRVDERGRHMLKIFEANNRAARGEAVEAEAMFVEALTVNPSIVGAWKDLGDLHLRRYDTIGAWICWDIARAIHPAHQMMRPVLDFEARLLGDHPEFFTTGAAGER